MEKLLPAIDMKPDTERVDDQLLSNTCVAHAGSSAIELCFKRAGQPIDFSRAYLYHGIFEFSRTLGLTDGGQTAALGVTLEKYGICREESMPYRGEDYEPSAEAVAEARQLFPAGSTAFQGITDLHDIKVSLNQGIPVMLTIKVNNGLMGLSGPWRTHAWDFSEQMWGLHAVLCIGYDDAAQRLLIENSWGYGWGDMGFGGIPYEAVTSQSVVVDGYRFTKLPVPFIPHTGYVDAGLPSYDFATQLLTIPTITYSPPAWGTPVKVHNVTLRITGNGTVEANSPKFAGSGGCYFMHKVYDDSMRLGLDRVLVAGVEYQNVLVQGNEMFELVSVGAT